jgi:hypothetical protein
MIAFVTRGAVLCRADELFALGQKGEAERCLQALAEEPHASVLHEMLRSVRMPGACTVLGDDVVAALRNPAVLAVLRDATPGAEHPGGTEAMGRSG